MVSGTQPPQRPDGDTPRDPWVGRRLGEKGPDGLGRYEVGRRLGRGGWATVYLAHDHALDRDVALKVPHGDLVDDESKRAAFEREVRKLKRVEHPNVVPVHDLVADDRGWPVAVLGFMRGGSLADRLERAPGHVQSLEEVLAWLGPVADALDHLHRDVQLVHADVKPENILFDGAGKPRLSDFGIVVSVVPGHSSVLAKTASSAGTPTYMAPELLGAGPASEGRGRTTPSPATDQYALAATVYRALSGVAPYDEPDTDDPLVYLAKWIGALQAGPPRPLDAVAAHAGRAVSDVVMRGLAREPSARHATCSALADALREAVRTPAGARAVPSEATVRIDARPPAPDAGPVAPVGRERVPAGASRANASGGAGAGAASRGPSRRRGVLAALFVLAAAGAGFLAWSNRGREGSPGDAPPGGSTARERERPPETPRAPTATLSLAITAPAEGALLAANPVHVEGTVSGAAGVKVTVNGTDATVTGERYEADVVAATDGELPIAVRASAPDAAPVTAARSVTVDTTAPVVRVVSPERGEATVGSDVESVDVRVSASDPHLASVTVDGQPAAAQPDGTYVATVRLAAGESKTVSVVATDAAKHASAPVAVQLTREAPKPPPPPAWRADLDAAIASALDGKLREAAGSWDAAVSKGMDAATAPAGLRRQIEAWKAPPELEVATPKEGATTAEATVRVTGTLRKGRTTDEVYVNGELVRTGPGAFDVPVEVAAGPFTVRVEVKDGGVARGAAIQRHGRREDAPWRAFLSGWAEPVGTALDEATKYPKRVRRTADGMEMVLIPAGTFPMGAVQGDKDASDDEKPRHSVTLTRAYYVDEHEVTNEQFGRFVSATRHVTEAERAGKGWIADDAGDWKETPGATWQAPLPGGNRPSGWARHPVVLVSWADAAAYARWAQVGLPTEAQFERALRGGPEDRVYPWGNTLPPPRGAGNFADATAKRSFSSWTTIDGYDDGFARTSPVKTYGANGYGLYDLSGDVWEWCADWYDSSYYGRSPPTDPPGPDSRSSRVVRGGSWYGLAWFLRASYRNYDAPANASGYLGFRCARSLPAPGGG